jgi:hypothetical protein
MDRMVKLYEAWAKPDKAAEWRLRRERGSQAPVKQSDKAR